MDNDFPTIICFEVNMSQKKQDEMLSHRKILSINKINAV
ncbi:Putative uncharacterized protein [Moritella viscosa]|nr:Putative uncharacterized protein [Moritella viscosa]